LYFERFKIFFPEKWTLEQKTQKKNQKQKKQTNKLTKQNKTKKTPQKQKNLKMFDKQIKKKLTFSHTI
jgi:hypothetical protein